MTLVSLDAAAATSRTGVWSVQCATYRPVADDDELNLRVEIATLGREQRRPVRRDVRQRVVSHLRAPETSGRKGGVVKRRARARARRARGDLSGR